MVANDKCRYSVVANAQIRNLACLNFHLWKELIHTVNTSTTYFSNHYVFKYF